MLRTFLTSVLIVLVSVLGFALVFVQPLIHNLLPQLLDKAGMEASYSELSIARQVNVALFILRRQGKSQPLLSIDSASATVTPLSLLKMDLESAVLSGSNIDIYLGTNTAGVITESGRGGKKVLVSFCQTLSLAASDPRPCAVLHRPLLA